MMIPVTPEQANELLQQVVEMGPRLVRIETMCEGRCQAAQVSRDDLRDELLRLRGDTERGRDRLEVRLDQLEDKLDRAIAGLTERQDEMKDAQWRDRIKLAGVGVGGGGVGATIMMLIQYFAGGK